MKDYVETSQKESQVRKNPVKMNKKMQLIIGKVFWTTE